MAIRNYADFLRYSKKVFGQSDTTAPQQATQRQPTENSGIIIAPKKPRGRQQAPMCPEPQPESIKADLQQNEQE